MVFAVEKLGICNDALLATGNQTVNVITDGSDEWNAVSNFYDRALPLLLAAHDWKFTLATGAMERVGTSAYPGYQDMYQLPSDCLLLRDCWDLRDSAIIQPVDSRCMSMEGIKLPPFEYRIIGGLIHCIAPSGAMCLYVQNPPSTALFPVTFVEALRLKIEVYLMRGFNEDLASVPLISKMAEGALSDARTQDSQQEPRRVIFRSGMLERRRRRRLL